MITEKGWQAMGAKIRELQAENEELKKLARFRKQLNDDLELEINKIKANAIREAVKETEQWAYTEDFCGDIIKYETVDMGAILEYANKLEDKQ